MQEVINYTGLPVSYKVNDGILIDAFLRGEDEEEVRGYIRFFYGTGLPSVCITMNGLSIEEVDEDPTVATDMTALFVDQDGVIDSRASGIIRTRGNTTRRSKEKPYSINLQERQSLFQMSACRKWALLNTFHGNTQRVCDKVALDLAADIGMSYTPESCFVNVYIDGEYHGLYLLAQRVNADGGSVGIHDLRKDNKKLNPDYYAQPDNKAASDPAISPANITGGYLLEFDNFYKDSKSNFQCGSQGVSVKEPKEATDEELTYISEYMNMLDRALFAEDGVDSETENAWADYIDFDSWARMYVMEEFFVQTDMTFSSFYMYKERNDAHLYAGPIWDFEYSCGNCSGASLGNEFHPETMKRTLWVHNAGDSWLCRMESNETFREKVVALFRNTFLPAFKKYMKEEFPTVVEVLSNSLSMNAVRWNFAFPNADKEIEECRQWMLGRADLLDRYLKDPDSYCKVTFRFGWGDLYSYIPEGQTLGFVPTMKYRETDSHQGRPSDQNGYLDHWEDAEGKQVSETTIITEDTTFYAIFDDTFPDILEDTEAFRSLEYDLTALPDLDCNAMLLITKDAWNKKEYQSTRLMELLKQCGLDINTLQSEDCIIILDQHQPVVILSADQNGASAELGGKRYRIFYSEDAFAIYQDSHELVVDSRTAYPEKGEAYLYLASYKKNGTWGEVRLSLAVDLP